MAPRKDPVIPEEEEKFQQYVFEMDDVLEALVGEAEARGVPLDYSLESLDRLEDWFEGWLGDELLESFPCFLVTETLANALVEATFSGLAFAEVTCTTSELFQELHPDLELPPFRRLVPEGRVELDEHGRVLRWTGHDLSLTQNAMLVVTAPVLQFLAGRIPYCDVDALMWQGEANK